MPLVERTMYFRRCNKHCYALNTQENPQARQIIDMLLRKEGLEDGDLVMVYKGRVISPTDSLQEVEDKGIVHVVDRREVARPNIDIDIKQKNGSSQTFTVESSLIVGEFIAKFLAKAETRPAYHIALVALGKVLHPEKSFSQELVENGSELMLIDFGQEIPVTQTTVKSNEVRTDGQQKVPQHPQQEEKDNKEPQPQQNQPYHEAGQQTEQPQQEKQAEEGEIDIQDLPENPDLVVRISSVLTEGSDVDLNNRVAFTQEEQDIIRKEEIIRREREGQADVQMGDLIYGKQVDPIDLMSEILKGGKMKFAFAE